MCRAQTSNSQQNAAVTAISTVIFDVDDTLLLTEAACFVMENEVLEMMGRAPMDRAVHLATWGMPLFDALPIRSPGVDLTEYERLYLPVFDRHIEIGLLDVLPDEHLDVLDALLASGRAVMLLTSRSEQEVRHLIAPDHPLSQRLARVYHADNVAELKPSPRVFDALLADSGALPRECVYVGDSPGDAAAATGAGLRFIATMQAGIRTRPDFASFAVDAFVDRFTDVPDAISNLDV